MSRTKKRKDGRYSRQVYLGRDAAGRRKYKTFYASTDREAQRLADEFRAALGKGLDPARAGATLGQLYDDLIQLKTAQGLGQSSLARYRSQKNHWGPLLQRPADQLRAADFQAVLNALADWHDGQPPLSHRTLDGLRASAKAAYALAIPEVVQYNPLAKTTTPAGTPPKARLPITARQQAWIRDTPHPAQRAAMLLLYSGLRRGEATALTWADIDLTAATISVTKSFDFAAGKIKQPKTPSGTRVVNIPRILVDYLRTQQDGCLYVLHNAHGQRLTQQAWRRLWESYMYDLNLKYGHGLQTRRRGYRELPFEIETFTPHQLRHTFCTLMYFAGVDVLTARDQMGHKDISITLGIYTTLDKKYKQKKISLLDSYLSSQLSDETG